MKQHSFRRLQMTVCSVVVLALALSGFSRASAAEKNLSNLRILIVGNSLSVDCSEYLPAVCKSCGYPNVTIGNCYIRGPFAEIRMERRRTGCAGVHVPKL